jgi:ubiquitin-activating enzyme E1
MSIPLNQNQNIDENLYSRQLYAIGLDTMKSLTKSKILISNITSLSTEIAKNIILTGVKMVTLHDTNNLIDDSCQQNFYIDINKEKGKSKLDILGKKLGELNPNVTVNKFSSKITESNIKKVFSSYNLIVFCNYSFDVAVYYNKVCRELDVKTIFCGSHGPYGYVFCDFLDEFYSKDIDGEKVKTGVLIKLEDNIFTSDKIHNLSVDDKIVIKSNIEDINGEYIIKKIVSPNKFILNKSFINNYQLINTNFTEIKQGKVFKFKSLEESIKNPEFVITDYSDFDKPNKLHNFNISHKESFINSDDIIYKKLCKTYKGDTIVINSVIGSIVAHNITSGCSNKYTPIQQWLYYDILELVDFDNFTGNEKEMQNIVFGDKLISKLFDSNIFIVGSGALGCEHLKNFCKIGVKEITITDMDTIEKSNLSRQFLFRNSDIGKFKSEVASTRAKQMNNKVKIIYHKTKVDKDSESLYNPEFYQNKSCIVNALDNVQARLFVDNKCIQNNVPLLESGTLGTKGNVQVILPNITETYGSTQDQVEESIPVCTLKNFPYLIEHTIQWARELFESLFVKPYEIIKQIKNKDLSKMNPNELYEIYDSINNIKDIISGEENYKDLIINGFKIYYKHYYNDIKALTTKFPKDSLNDENQPFWSGSKRFPEYKEFDINNEYCVMFIKSYINIVCDVYNKERISEQNFSELLEETLKEFKNTDTEIIKVSKNEEEEKKKKEEEISSMSSEEYIININNSINKIKKYGNPNEFEKDSELNNHIDFITSSSNMRALNYQINTIDKFETKGIAGKIIPALATTTALVSGLVCIEYIKIINKMELDNYKNTFLNVGLSFIGSSEPIKCKNEKVGNLEINLWTQLKEKDMKLGEFISYFEEKYDVEIEMINFKSNIIYSSFMNTNKNKQNIIKNISEICYNENNNIILDLIIKQSNDDINLNDENETYNVSCKIY